MPSPLHAFQPTPALAELIGPGRVRRLDAQARVIAYLQRHNLRGGNTVRTDTKLRALVGERDTVTLVELTALVNANLEE